MIGPGPEHQLTVLLVKGVVGDVDLTDGLEHAARLPVHAPVALDDGPELTVVAVQILRTANMHTVMRKNDNERMLDIILQDPSWRVSDKISEM